MKKVNKVNWVKAVLRNASKKWPARNEAIKNARKQRGIYECKQCKSEVKRGQYHLDHKDPVIPLEGAKKHPIRINEDDMNEWIDRLFCNEDNFQLLCIKCHESKTTIENEMRSFYKKKKRKKK